MTKPAGLRHNDVTMRSALLLLLTLMPALAHAWGFAGHRRLASKLQDALPANHCLRTWYSARQTYSLQDSACDPDRWRSTDTLEAPRHYLNIDWVNPVSSYPRDYNQAVAQLGPTYARTNGTVPWRVEEKYGELVAAFRSGNQTAILDTTFVLSHYVFDSVSLLHNTRDFDPNGLHERWESDMLEDSSRINAITTSAVTYYGTSGLADPRYNVFDLIIVGNGLAPQLIAADVAADAGVVALYNSTRDMTARRWGDGITLMSSIVWTAWNEAGRPELTGFTTSCSRAAPVSDLVVVGYPPSGGFTHGPDAGVPMGGGSGSTGGGVGSTGGGVGTVGGGDGSTGGGVGTTGGGVGTTGGGAGTTGGGDGAVGGGDGTTGGGDGVLGGGTGSTAGAGGRTFPDPFGPPVGGGSAAGTGCSAVPGSALALIALALWRARRRRR